MRKKKSTSFVALILVIAIILTGCKSTAGTDTTTTTDSTTATETETSTDTTGAQATTVSTTSEIKVDTVFTANDLEVGYEESSATFITFKASDILVSGDGASAEEGVVTISKKGTYVISGTLEDGQIVVAAEDKDKVQLVLNGVTMYCSDNAPIYIKKADKVFITLEENTVNTLTDGSEYVQSDENTVDGVIFSMADLAINGSGTLNITANYKHGILSKDDLVFTGGIINITAVKDAINGKDCVKIKDGTFTLSTSTGNGIQSKNGEDTATGYVYISGGTITVTDCMEGIEGTVIAIEGGIIDITARDDGFNASSGDTITSTTDATSSATIDNGSTPKGMGRGGFGGGGGMENDPNCYISILGGTITINAVGDGIDSNGSLAVSGGTTYVSGPTSNGDGGLDYNGSAEITGGIIVVAGSTGMAQGFSDTSTQYSLLYNLTSSCAAGTKITLTDAEGNVIVTDTPNKEYQSVVISSPDLANGVTYTLTCGDQTADITLSSIVTSNGQSGMGGQPGQGGMPNGQGNQDGLAGKGGMTRPGSGN